MMRGELEWNSAAVYQTYIRTFNESREGADIGIGNLRGITEKRDYLDDLGVDAVWISPFYPSGMVDGGYDISDYTGVDPELGDMDDFSELVDAYHERDMKVMVDLVPNHTSDQHPWFVESSASSDNPKSDWYIWHDPKPDGSPPNNWTSVFSTPQLNKQSPTGIKVPDSNNTPAVSAWEWNETRNQYYLRDFAAEQPNLNWQNPQVREAIKDVMRTWLDRGVDGFRVDAANYLGKNPNFSDEAPNPNYHEAVDNPHDQFAQYHSVNYPPTLYPYLQELTSVLDEPDYSDRDLRMILECWMPPEDLKKVDNVSSKASSFNFTRLTAPWDAQTHKSLLDNYYADRRDVIGNQVLSNHDVPRIASRMGQAAARSAAVLNLTLPGMAFIYNGEEGGFTDVDVPPHRRRDNDLGERDNARTPMLWDDSENAGFSQANPGDLWLPIDPEYETKNLENAARDPQSTFSLYRTLLHMRRGSETLQRGNYHPLSTDNPDVLAFARQHENDQTITMVNFADQPADFRLYGAQQATGRIILSSLSPQTSERTEMDDTINLQPNEGVVVIRSA